LNDLSKADVEAMRRAAGAQPREDATKPYFIGQTPDSGAPPKPLINPQPAEAPVRQTTLFDTHRGLNAKMAPFAGWEMPIQYPCGISAEHRAVRVAAGLFDVSHMMAIEVSGHHALEFLETALANCASRLDPGECQYSAMLYPDGSAVDDVYVYRLERERFMVVANAGNASRVWAWLEAVNGRRVAIDPADLAKEAPGPVTIRDLRDAGADSRCGLALQGPASLRALQALTHAQAEKDRLARLKMNQWTLARVAGEPALAARTGYTGEKMGFEIYVHPAQAPKVWAAILDAGQASGVTAAGLGARDSARVEAGLPLFGHEIEGELGVSLVEAGYGFVFKLHKPFFIGRQAHMARAAASKRRVIRLQGQGRKSLRAGHVILDGQGGVAGQVTSFAYAHADMTFIVLALVNESFAPQPGEAVKGARVSPAEAASGVEERQRVDLTAMTRFPTEEERFGWVARYR